jgi:hypothetical protein
MDEKIQDHHDLIVIVGISNDVLMTWLKKNSSKLSTMIYEIRTSYVELRVIEATGVL